MRSQTKAAQDRSLSNPNGDKVFFVGYCVIAAIILASVCNEEPVSCSIFYTKSRQITKPVSIAQNNLISVVCRCSDSRKFGFEPELLGCD